MENGGFVVDETAIKRGEVLFRSECQFVAGAATPDRIPPPTIGEIAFAGRSNVGKSSLINALTGRKALARSSRTPGRTQQINFFDLGGLMYLVDLPGYGYAVSSKKKIFAWNDMICGYLRGRQTLKRVCILIDSRHSFKDSDQDAMNMLDRSHVPYTIVLTKADKITATELQETIARIEDSLKSRTTAFPTVFATSSDKKKGIAELRAFLASGI
ncbi:MAG: YihA family ribosome biogenesis GTP-binding protein [Alphaproteobacteria bacterium]|nr:YihA family ribosome biogenesis GTP-binding protein [Alphaproteobacteria bacterium]MCK5658710.1 YihA family ribosome biogenesis GTP-binding protein [Alphaproteobacteria bacterium]